jgi:hypothetical protein
MDIWCTFILFVLSCVKVEALRLVDPPSKKSYRLSKDQETEVKQSVSRMPYASEGATGD